MFTDCNHALQGIFSEFQWRTKFSFSKPTLPALIKKYIDVKRDLVICYQSQDSESKLLSIKFRVEFFHTSHKK